MTNPTTQFFEDLRSRGHEPLVAGVEVTVRFDVTQGKQTDHWLLGIDHGDVAVTSSDADADCVLAADRSVFDRIVSGEANAMAALLRGELTTVGDPELLVLCQRLFPGPPDQRVRPSVAAERGPS